MKQTERVRTDPSKQNFHPIQDDIYAITRWRVGTVVYKTEVLPVDFS
jgi:hypothetical protein